MFNSFVPMFDLQLFADGAAAVGSGNAAEAGAPSAGTSANSELAAPKQDKNPAKRGGKPDLSKVVYGKQEAAREGSDNADPTKDDTKTFTANTPGDVPDKKAVFEELIKGEYKDAFSARVEGIVNDRLKGSKETVERYNELSPTLTMLYEKYGVKDGDIKALNKAIADDDAFYEAEALERGVSVEQLKEFKKTQRENAELRRAQQERNAREGAERQYAEWMRQTDAAKQYYGSLDLRTELQNPVFMRLLRSGIDVKTAFEVVHKDEIIPAAMQYTAKKVEEQMASKVKAAASRPSENGTASRSTAVVKSDVNSFSNDDLDEIIRRARRGDKIRL